MIWCIPLDLDTHEYAHASVLRASTTLLDGYRSPFAFSLVACLRLIGQRELATEPAGACSAGAPAGSEVALEV